MTEEQKDILIAKMIDRPAELTEADICAIMADEELRELYEVSVSLKDAFTEPEPIDAAAEWERFKPRLISPRKRSYAQYYRIVAAVAGVALLAAVTFSIINREPTSSSVEPYIANVTKPKVTEPKAADASQAPVEPAVTASSSPAAAKPKMARSKSAGAEHRHTVNEQVASATTPEEPPFDMDEYLRLQQARLDNELAMQRAEAIRCQYYSMVDTEGHSLPAMATVSSYGDGNTLDNNLSFLVLQ